MLGKPTTHYTDIIMVWWHLKSPASPFLLNCLLRRISKKASKLCVTGPFAGNSPITGEFPAQMASNGKGFHLMTSSCLTNHCESSCLGSLLTYTLSLWGLWHGQPYFITSIETKLLHLHQYGLNIHIKYHKDSCVHISRGDTKWLPSYKSISQTCF